MKLCIVGDDAAKAINGWIQKAGYVPVTTNYDYKVTLIEGDVSTVTVDGIDSDLERRVVYQMELNGIARFILQRAGGVRSDREIRIVYPKSMQTQVEKGVYQGLMLEVGNYATKKQHRTTKAAKVARVAGFLTIISLLATLAYPQERFPIVRFWDGLNIVNAGDLLNNAVRTNCVLGCGASTQYTSGTNTPGNLTGNVIIWRDEIGMLYPATTQTPLPVNVAAGILRLDSSFFFAGTHYAAPVGGLFDDTAPDVLNEDDFGINRLTANRATHVNLRNNGGAEIGIAAAPIRTDPTGTTRQPVDLDRTNGVTVGTATATGDGACIGLTTTSATIVSANASRRFISLYLRETATAIVYIKLGATATASDLPLAIGQGLILPNFIYTGQIDGISASGTQSVCWVEL